MRAFAVLILTTVGCDDGKGPEWSLDSGLLSDDTASGGDAIVPGCTVEIPTWAGVISGAQTTNYPDEVAWVCAGGEVAANAADAVYFVEPGGKVVVNSANALLFIRSGGEAVINSTTVTVYYEDKGDFVLNVPLYEANACDEVVFVGGPEPGCG